MQVHSCASSAAFFGGKNSNDSAGAGVAADRAGRPAKRGPVSQRSSVAAGACVCGGWGATWFMDLLSGL